MMEKKKETRVEAGTGKTSFAAVKRQILLQNHEEKDKRFFGPNLTMQLSYC